MGLNGEIEAAGLNMMQAILLGFATAKTEGLTSQDLVEAIIKRELTVTEASRLVELERAQYDTIEQIIGLPLRH